MAKRGRKEKYRTNVAPYLNAIEREIEAGMTLEEIADSLKVARSSFYNYMESHPELLDSIKSGRKAGVNKVVSALFTKALTGDVAACAFYLKNRDAENWREKQQIDHTVNMTLAQTLDELDEK